MKSTSKKTLRRTTLISISLGSLLIGLFFSYKNISLSAGWLLAVLPLGLTIYKYEKLRLPIVIFLGILFGLWRGSMIFDDLQKYQSLYGAKLTFVATVVDDPGFNTERNQIEFHVANIQTEKEKLIGKIQVGIRKGPSIGRGDIVQVSGRLQSLKGTSRQGFVSMADVKVVKQNTSWLEEIRSKFFASVQHALPEPYASLGLGYLVGLRTNIPKELSDQLKVVGLTHIIAVSGYNLTIIVQAVRRIFAKHSAYQAVLFTSLLLLGFLMVAGSSAPITRATVICSFSLLAWYYGREVKPVILLLLSGALTAFVNPLYIWGDPGWYLSFLAFAGVLVLAPLITKFLYKNRQPGTIMQIFIETVSAQVVTIPYTLYLFGNVSIIAPIANLLVLPFIPIIMLMVFVVGLVGMIVPNVAIHFALLPNSLLALQVWTIDKLSSVSFASIELSITLPIMIALFLTLMSLVIFLSKITNKNHTTAMDEFDYNLL